MHLGKLLKQEYLLLEQIYFDRLRYLFEASNADETSIVAIPVFQSSSVCVELAILKDLS